MATGCLVNLTVQRNYLKHYNYGVVSKMKMKIQR
jgi:hypothetical protein